MIIPKTIYFCHKSKDGLEKYIANWKKLNQSYDISLSDNTDCEKFLLNEYGNLHLEIFKYIPDGPIKADFWRVCILFKYGGIYSDVDNKPLVPINDFIEDNIQLCTCSSFWKEKDPYTGQVSLYNPNFIISTKNNPILKACINWYLESYIENKPYSYWGWSIMNVMSEVLELKNYDRSYGIYYEKNENLKVQILEEVKGKKRHDDHNVYKDKRIFNNRYKSWDRKTHGFKKNLLYSIIQEIKKRFYNCLKL